MQASSLKNSLSNVFTKLYKKIRLLKNKGKEPYLSLYKILGFYPDNIQIYEQAFLHKSSSIKGDDGRWLNNERLEFLGDAILDAVIADI
ncbi:MAG: ribonuclease III, partial [Parabacteroides sp.]|nr:ribonuclease III [Parabacteroides sp.]